MGADPVAGINESKFELMALDVARGKPVKDAAAAAGVSVRTGFSWAARPDFRGKVAELRAAMLAETIGRLSAAATAAVATMVLLLDKQSPPTVRLGAARGILSSLIEMRAHVELSARVEDLERRLADNDRHQGTD